MALLTNKNTDDDKDLVADFHFPTSSGALIIFTRFPELGKCKTRLAATIGDESALLVYKELLAHTAAITKNLKADKFVYYTESLHKNDQWDNNIYSKRLQFGDDLGARMQNAFSDVFASGYEKAIIIGSDMFDMNTNDLEEAFQTLENHDYVIGPAEDGGYYLLGMKQINEAVFRKKEWGTKTVLAKTIEDLKLEKLAVLSKKNDIDYYDDMKHIEVLQKHVGELKTNN